MGLVKKAPRPDTNMENYCNILLTQRDLASAELLNSIIQEATSQLPSDISADERLDMLTRKTNEALMQLSTSLLLKLGPSVKTILSHQNSIGIDQELVSIKVPLLPIQEKTTIYHRMFFNIVDNVECTSFACVNRNLLGQLSEKEMFILLLFIFINCKRVKYDDLLSLFITGLSSTGKSKIFEQVILKSCHNFVTSSSTDSGVGRFNSSGKNILFLHDISIKSLLGADVEKIKCLCRAELVSAKTFGGVALVHPMFVFATSNERLLDHTIMKSPTSWPLKLPSQAKLMSKKSAPNLLALQNRFLELHIRKKPQQLANDLKHSDGFEKREAILALYKPVLDIMTKYKPDDFHSVHLYTYVLNALGKQCEFYKSIYQENLLPHINTLFQRYNVQQSAL